MSDFFANFQSTKEDHVHEEKVIHLDRKILSQHEMLVPEKTTANESAPNKVLEENFLRKSKLLDEGIGEQNRCPADRISGKRLSRILLEEDFLESFEDSNLPCTQFRKLKLRSRTKHSVGTVQLQKDGEILVKTDGDKCITYLENRKFESSEAKRSTEAEKAERIEKLFLRHGNGNRGIKSQDVYTDLTWSSTPPVKGKQKSSCNELQRKEKAVQRKAQKKSEQLKMVVNNLVSAISFSFQNALALKQQHGQQIDKSFLTFFLRRELRKMFLIKELIKELETVAGRFKFHYDDSKNISETVESLYSLMGQDLKNPDEQKIREINTGENRNCFRVITAFVIAGCVAVVFSLIVAFIANSSAVIPAIIVFIFTALVSFHMFRQIKSGIKS